MLQLFPSHPLSTVHRSVPLRMRSDLIVRMRQVGNKRSYIIKDPISLVHHRLWEEEYALLCMLDGATSLASMKRAFEERFPAARLDVQRLQVLHGRFHRNDLVVSDGPDQGGSLYRRFERNRIQSRWNTLRSWLSIRFRGFNPDPLLEVADRRIGWFFSPLALVVIAAGILLTLMYFVVHGSSVVAKLPPLDAYLTPVNFVWLLVSLALLKILHEIGHGLACKHYGGECNEMGILFLLFTPCLYCDVTDSWMIDSKWKRAMIAAAGIWFEWIAASLCMWIWWLSHPGILNAICLQTMLVGSIGTLAFNGNPLLRYDGYYVLSDLLDHPNLWRRANEVVRRSIGAFYMKRVDLDSGSDDQRGIPFLWWYGLVSGLYRWVLSIVILYVLYRILHALRLEWMAAAMIASILIGVIAYGGNGALCWVSDPRTRRHLRMGRVSMTLLIVVAVIAFVVWFPLPAAVRAPVSMQSANARSVVVTVEGRLVRALREGTVVKAGDVIALLESKELGLKLATRRGELARQRAKLVGLESRRGDEPLIAAQIPTVREAIAGLETEVKRVESEFDQLTLLAPIDGVLLAPGQINPPIDEIEIATWSGSPLEPQVVGAFLRRGTLVCQVGAAASIEGIAYLTQHQVELVRPNERASLKISSLPEQRFEGHVVEVGSTDHSDIPSELVRSGIVPVRIDRQGMSRWLSPMYAVRIALDRTVVDSAHPHPIHHSLGTATISVAPQPIATRVARFLYQTFAVDPTVQQRSGP